MDKNNIVSLLLENHSLSGENESLLLENESLLGENKNLSIENESLLGENKRLSLYNNTLYNDKRILEQQLNKLMIRNLAYYLLLPNIIQAIIYFFLYTIFTHIIYFL